MDRRRRLGERAESEKTNLRRFMALVALLRGGNCDRCHDCTERRENFLPSSPPESLMAFSIRGDFDGRRKFSHSDLKVPSARFLFFFHSVAFPNLWVWSKTWLFYGRLSPATVRMYVPLPCSAEMPYGNRDDIVTSSRKTYRVLAVLARHVCNRNIVITFLLPYLHSLPINNVRIFENSASSLLLIFLYNIET